ncbi:MAG: rhodanese-like domain-containing protein [Candidatus Rokubacteria bacterium]|nr:rhodanese-like domain-containing protein [Candidatus Rokubacteria bacterium]
MRKGVAGVVLAAGAVLGLGPAPAGNPEVPLELITVDELKAHMDKKVAVDLIDVRTWSEYVKRHIPGARSMPLRAVPSRAFEIKKTGLVVFY